MVLDSILTTKLYIPLARPSLVPRPRLTDRLNEGLRRKLTLISAPAGFGKTTLLSEWRTTPAGSEWPLAWVSLDKGDVDLTRFLAQIIAALQTIYIDLGKAALAMLRVQQLQPPSTESILTTLLNEINTVAGQGFALVLDDYHAVDAQPVHSAMTFLLDHLPPQMHLVITSRTDPPLPLTRLRARGQMIELRADDLRFTPDETAALFNQVMGFDLSAADIAVLETRTEGWVAGLQMAALSMQRHDAAHIADFIKAFTGADRYIVDYLADEVLQRQPEGVQTFLLLTSILERLSGSLCDAVTGQVDGQAMLERLERANLFVVPLDNKRQWYRYHHLFADFLRGRLQQSQPDLVSDLHRRAAEWYEGEGLLVEAVEHALVAADFERAARLIEEMLTQTGFIRGTLTQAQNWLEALPEEVVHSRPRLSIAYAWALLFSGQLDAVESPLQKAQLALPEHDRDQIILGQVAAVRSFVACYRGEASRSIELSRQALEYTPDDNVALRGILAGCIALNLGTAYGSSIDVAEAHRVLSEAAKVSQVPGSLYAALPAIGLLGEIEVAQGHLHQAARTYKQTLQLAAARAEQGAQPTPVPSWAYMGMGELLYEWNDLDAAAYHLEEGIALAKQGGNAGTLSSSYIILARVLQAKGDADGADEMIVKAEELARTSDIVWIAAHVAAYQVRLWLAQGNLAAAARWAQSSGLSVEDEIGYRREGEYTTLARAYIALHEYERALELLRWLLGVMESARLTGRVIEILVLQALAHQAADDTAEAMTTLERALTLAEPEGYVRVFVDEGVSMADLLTKTLEAHRKRSRDIVPQYVSKLLAAFEQPSAGVTLLTQETPPEKTSPPILPLIEPLSGRELEVLRLVGDGLSNREIAEELVVTVGTVKWHIHNIYSKLDVRSRIQAVARSRELALL